MASWFLRGLRRGVVTTRYPKGPLDPWVRHLPSPPAFHPERLTTERARGLAEACPAGAMTVEGGELVVDLAHCCACGLCVERGGDAVVPSGAFLLAGRAPSEYVKRVPIAGDPGGQPRHERNRDVRD